jgi:hypothetical protein
MDELLVVAKMHTDSRKFPSDAKHWPSGITHVGCEKDKLCLFRMQVYQQMFSFNEPSKPTISHASSVDGDKRVQRQMKDTHQKPSVDKVHETVTQDANTGAKHSVLPSQQAQQSKSQFGPKEQRYGCTM